MSELQTAPIKSFTLGIYDGPHATPKEVDVGPVFLGIKNVTPEGRLDFSEIRHVSEQEYPKWTKRVTPQKDDVVFSYEATLHRYALIPEGFRGCLGRRMALVRPDQNKIVPRFLHYYFMSPSWRAVVEANIINGATVDRIPIKKFPDFKVSIPSISKQRSISYTLSAYDDLIENNRRRIQLLEQAARLLYKEWFVHLRFPGHEHTQIIDGVPDGWEKGVVSDFYNTASGGTPSRKNPKFYGGDIKWVKTQELQDGFLFDTEEHITEDAIKKSATKLFPANTVLIAMYGATIGQVGVIVDPSTCNQACCAVMPRAEGTSYEHVFLFFLSCKEGLRNLGQGAAQKNISQQVIRGYEMILPNKLTLKLFRDYAESFLGQIRTLQAMNRQLTKARDLLLPKLMNGEVVV